MDITITLYSTSDEPNKVEKTLSTNSFVITGKLKEEQDITAPAITIAIPILSTGVPATDIFQWNYAYISQPFKRYYFITGFDTGLNNLVTIYFEEDYLMSWKTNIYNLTPLVTRQATEYNPMLFDGDIPIDSEPETIIESYDFYNLRMGEGTPSEQFPLNKKTTFKLGTNSSYLISTFVTKGVNFANRLYNPKSCSSPFTPTFSLSNVLLTLFAERCFDNNFISSLLTGFFTNISEYVSSVYYVPWLQQGDASGLFIAGQQIYQANSIPIANSSVTLEENGETYNCVMLTQNQIFILPSNEIKITVRKFYNFIDLLTDIDMYIPFYGWVTLDNKLLLKFAGVSNTLTSYGYYFIDISSLQFSFILTTQNLNLHYVKDVSGVSGVYDNVDMDKIIFSCSGNIGGNSPWGSTNKTQVYKNLLVGGVTTVAGIMAGAPTLTAAGIMQSIGGESASIQKAERRLNDKRVKRPETIAKRKEELAAAKRSEVGRDIRILTSNAIRDILPNITPSGGITSSGTLSGGSFLTERSILLRYSYPKPNIPSNYYELYGGYCNLTLPLLELKGKGFTVCANLHMTGFPNCTLEEINEIEDLLLSGVIL